MTDKLTRIRERCDKQRQDIRDATGKDYTSARQQTFNEGAFTAYGDLLAILNESEPAGAGPDDRKIGLYRKYDVRRVNDPTGKHAECWYFVLDPKHDKFARIALLAYAQQCESEYPALAMGLRAAAAGAAQPTPAEQPTGSKE